MHARSLFFATVALAALAACKSGAARDDTTSRTRAAENRILNGDPIYIPGMGNDAAVDESVGTTTTTGADVCGPEAEGNACDGGASAGELDEGKP